MEITKDIEFINPLQITNFCISDKKLHHIVYKKTSVIAKIYSKLFNFIYNGINNPKNILNNYLWYRKEIISYYQNLVNKPDFCINSINTSSEYLDIESINEYVDLIKYHVKSPDRFTLDEQVYTDIKNNEYYKVYENYKIHLTFINSLGYTKYFKDIKDLEIFIEQLITLNPKIRTFVNFEEFSLTFNEENKKLTDFLFQKYIE